MFCSSVGSCNIHIRMVCVTSMSLTVEEPKFICKQAYTWDIAVRTLPQVQTDGGQSALLVLNCGCIAFLCYRIFLNLIHT